MTRIKAVQRGTNAALIATAQALYPMDGMVLDLTPGDSLGFWKEHTPDRLELLPGGFDFRRTVYDDGQFDDVVFDPPYVTKGGHATSTIDEMNTRYGMLHVEATPMAQWERQIVPGLVEAKRILRRPVKGQRAGRLWFKLQDYVTSGHVWWFAKLALTALDVVGFDLVDEFILDGHPGPQPTTDRCKACAGVGHRGPATGAEPCDYGRQCDVCTGAGTVPRRQLHAARAHSVLLIAESRR